MKSYWDDADKQFIRDSLKALALHHADKLTIHKDERWHNHLSKLADCADLDPTEKEYACGCCRD